jgi:hypothetical protein
MSKFAALGVDPASTSRMEIILPGETDPLTDVNGAPAYIDFLPWDSEPGRKFERAQQIATVRKGFRARTRAELRADAETTDVIAEQAERLAVLAVGWHLVGADRKVIDVPFSSADARELFSAPETAWIRRQAWVWVSNEANFMRSSSKS